MYIDNEGLEAAFSSGQDFGDGRSQGILCEACRNTKIYKNTVINSSSDGIGLVGRDSDSREAEYSEQFEIYDNTVMHNAEQGIWLVHCRDGKIYGNKVWKNASRPDTTGGSSGITYEAHVYDTEIYENDIAYNDVLGISIMLSSDISIHNNDIHHNADGAIGWGEWFTPQGRFAAPGLDEGVFIRNNAIHDNMGSAFFFMTDVFDENVVVEDNIFTGNGVDVRHFEEFENHDISTHPEIWEYNGDNIMFRANQERFSSQFAFGENTIDGISVTGIFRSEGAQQIDEDGDDTIQEEPIRASANEEKRNAEPQSERKASLPFAADDAPEKAGENSGEKRAKELSGCPKCECDESQCPTCEDCDAIRGLLILSTVGTIVLGSVLLLLVIRRRKQGTS
jgi:parallel beta-helix repeat protein